MPHGWKLRLVDIDQTLYFIKFKKLYSSKNTSKKWKNKPHLRKANLKSYILIKVSNLENSNSSYKSITKRQPDLKNNNNNKWLRGITRKDIQLVIRHKKRCSPPLDIREMQIKITMNYHFISTRIVKIKEASVDKEMKTLEYFTTAGGNREWCSCFAKQLLWQFPERLDGVVMWPNNSTPTYVPKSTENILPHKNV